jgi:hypothetical protein
VGRVKKSVWASRWEFELSTADRQTIASVRGWPLYSSSTVSAGGKSFTVNKPKIPAGFGGAESWPPGIAELAARSWRDDAGHYARKTMKKPAPRYDVRMAPLYDAREVRELVDETGTPILYTSGNSYNYRAYARITFPDQRWLRFLVRGTDLRNAIMTAVDQAGNKVARYRRIVEDDKRFSVEMAVHPDLKLTDELMLVIVMSPPWLYHYFDTSK